MVQIEVWSDVVCPFCYIGKRRLEEAIARFPHAEEVVVEWKSFLLDPNTETQVGKSINEHLAERKGWTMEQTREINKYVTDMAAGVGLDYNFDKVVVANSVNAHRVLQLAKRMHLGDAVKEALLKAYFVEGRNIDDPAELLQLAVEQGLSEADVTDVLANETLFRKQVFADAEEAGYVGARGVPFFVFNRRYAVSGAQPTDAFLSVLEKVYGELPVSTEQTATESNADACAVDGEC